MEEASRVDDGSGRHVEARCQPDSNVQVCIILRAAVPFFSDLLEVIVLLGGTGEGG